MAHILSEIGLPGETLREAAEAIDRVEEGRSPVEEHGVHVETDLVYHLDGWLRYIFVVLVESDGMADEVNGVGLEFEFMEEVAGGLLEHVDV